MALIHYSFDSKVLMTKAKVLIVLPDVQWDETTIGKKFQTVYLLHGGGEDYTSYIRYSNIETWANERMFAVIMPDGGNSSFMDMKYGADYYTYLSEELPTVMQNVFPLSRKKQNRFVAGFSMGALGSLHWALDKPDFFNSVAVMSGGCDFYEANRYIEPGEAKPKEDVFYCAFGGADRIRGSRGDIFLLAKEMTETVDKSLWPKMFSVVGKEDFMLIGCLKYKDYLSTLGINMELHIDEGGHNWQLWNKWLPEILDWFQPKRALVSEENCKGGGEEKAAEREEILQFPNTTWEQADMLCILPWNGKVFRLEENELLLERITFRMEGQCVKIQAVQNGIQKCFEAELDGSYRANADFIDWRAQENTGKRVPEDTYGGWYIAGKCSVSSDFMRKPELTLFVQTADREAYLLCVMRFSGSGIRIEVDDSSWVCFKNTCGMTDYSKVIQPVVLFGKDIGE